MVDVGGGADMATVAAINPYESGRETASTSWSRVASSRWWSSLLFFLLCLSLGANVIQGVIIYDLYGYFLRDRGKPNTVTIPLHHR